MTSNLTTLQPHSLLKVGYDVVNILYANGEANKVGSHACLTQLLVGKLTVGVAGRMKHAGAGIGNVGNDADELQVIHKPDSILASALQSECDNTA